MLILRKAHTYHQDNDRNPSIAPYIHPWDVPIDNYLFPGKLACFSDNFTIAESLLATSVEAAVDYTADVNGYNQGKMTAFADALE